MIAHGIIQLTSVEATAAEQRTRRNQKEEAEAEETVVTQVDLRDQEGALQGVPHRVPVLLKDQGLVAEAVEGDIQEGKPLDHPQEVPLVSPLAGPLPIHDRCVEITCRENVKENLRTASVGIPALPLL